MIRKIISIQEKRYKIISPRWYCGGEIPTTIWAEGIFTTEKEAETIYKKVLEDYNQMVSLLKKPELIYYWEEIERKTEILPEGVSEWTIT